MTKLSEGRLEDIKPCICCHSGCFNFSSSKGHANTQDLTDPTQPVSKVYPFYFMLNLAVGGNGWPVDLSRYEIIDLYADFVRVFAG